MNTKFTFGKIVVGIVILLFGGFLWATLKPSDHAGQALDRASETAKGTVAKISDGAAGLKDKTAAMVDNAAGRAGEMAGQVFDKAGDVAGKVADQAEGMADKVTETASDAYRATTDMAENAMEKAGDMADQAASKAGDAYQAAENMADNAMENAGGMAGGITDAEGGRYTAAGTDGHASRASTGAIQPLAEKPMSEAMDSAEPTMASGDEMMAKVDNAMDSAQSGERMVEVPAKFEMNPSRDAMGPTMTDDGTWRYEAIRFGHNQWELAPGAFTSLNGLAAMMKEQPELNIEIHGHTDSSGRREYNMDLSRKRAEAVKTYLESQGIAASRMETKAYGPDRPIPGKAYEGPMSDNRRIEIKPLN